MRPTETARFLSVRSRSLSGLLTLGLLAGAHTLAQTAADPTLPGAAPATEQAPRLGLPATTNPPSPTQEAPVNTAPSGAVPASPATTDATPTNPAATEQAPAEAQSTDPLPVDNVAPADAPADTAPTDTPPVTGEAPASSLPAPGSVKVPVLEGEKVLKTVPTVLGEALVYAAGTEDALPRTLEALKAGGYALAGSSGETGSSVRLSRDDEQFELRQTDSFGVTVVALSRVLSPADSGTPPAPAPDTAAPTETAPAGVAPADPAPGTTAPAGSDRPTTPAPAGTNPTAPDGSVAPPAVAPAPGQP